MANLETEIPNLRLANRRGEGFTLVELLLVIATVMIAAISVAGPSLANFFRGRTLDSEARRLLALTHAGQSRAVGEGVPMRLWVDVEQKSYGLKEEPGWPEQDPKEGSSANACRLSPAPNGSSVTRSPRAARLKPSCASQRCAVSGCSRTPGLKPKTPPSASSPSCSFRRRNWATS